MELISLGFAEVIEVRAGSEAAEKPQYYVHYCNFDKRLDEWIDEDRFLTPEQIDMHRQAEMASSGAASVTTSASAEASFGGGVMERTLTRTLRRKFQEQHQQQSSSLLQARTISRPVYDDPVVEQLEKEHEEATKVKNIQKIEIGRYEIDCWYFSPFPDAYSQADKLFLCEGCLKYMRYAKTLVDHRKTCKRSSPPGKMIYRKDNLVVYELDGEAEKLYCQNLCLLAKLFLDHKTLYYDVAPFFFYALCEVDEEGVHLVGYFSKEKESPDNYNLACIMIMPPHQRKGYGRFLIQLSYEICKRERKSGSPEKPLSDLGLVSYRSFWAQEILWKLRKSTSRILTIEDICEQTAFKRDDVVDTLARLNLLSMWRGQPTLNYSARVIEEHLKVFAAKQFTLVDSKHLSWPDEIANVYAKKSSKKSKK